MCVGAVSMAQAQSLVCACKEGGHPFGHWPDVRKLKVLWVRCFWVEREGSVLCVVDVRMVKAWRWWSVCQCVKAE